MSLGFMGFGFLGHLLLEQLILVLYQLCKSLHLDVQRFCFPIGACRRVGVNDKHKHNLGWNGVFFHSDV